MISDSGRIFFLHEEVETEFPQLNRNDFQVSLLRQENEKGVMKFVLYKWNYLKTSEEAKDYSPCELLENQGPFEFPILCDTGSADVYKKDHLFIEDLTRAAKAVQEKNLENRSFIDKLLEFHAKHLRNRKLEEKPREYENESVTRSVQVKI